MDQISTAMLPNRWLSKTSTIIATLSFLAPWLFFLGGCSVPQQEYNALELATDGPIIGFNLAVLLALPAVIGLVVLIFIAAKSKVSQQWIERLTLAMASIAVLPALDLVISLRNLQQYVELRWGIWANLACYGMVACGAVINLWRLRQFPTVTTSASTVSRTAYVGFMRWNILIALLLLVGLLTQVDNPEIRRAINRETIITLGYALPAFILGGTGLSYTLWRTSD